MGSERSGRSASRPCPAFRRRWPQCTSRRSVPPSDMPAPAGAVQVRQRVVGSSGCVAPASAFLRGPRRPICTTFTTAREQSSARPSPRAGPGPGGPPSAEHSPQLRPVRRAPGQSTRSPKASDASEAADALESSSAVEGGDGVGSRADTARAWIPATAGGWGDPPSQRRTHNRHAHCARAHARARIIKSDGLSAVAVWRGLYDCSLNCATARSCLCVGIRVMSAGDATHLPTQFRAQKLRHALARARAKT